MKGKKIDPEQDQFLLERAQRGVKSAVAVEEFLAKWPSWLGPAVNSADELDALVSAEHKRVSKLYEHRRTRVLAEVSELSSPAKCPCRRALPWHLIALHRDSVAHQSHCPCGRVWASTSATQVKLVPSEPNLSVAVKEAQSVETQADAGAVTEPLIDAYGMRLTADEVSLLDRARDKGWRTDYATGLSDAEFTHLRKILDEDDRATTLSALEEPLAPAHLEAAGLVEPVSQPATITLLWPPEPATLPPSAVTPRFIEGTMAGGCAHRLSLDWGSHAAEMAEAQRLYDGRAWPSEAKTWPERVAAMLDHDDSTSDKLEAALRDLEASRSEHARLARGVSAANQSEAETAAELAQARDQLAVAERQVADLRKRVEEVERARDKAQMRSVSDEALFRMLPMQVVSADALATHVEVLSLTDSLKELARGTTDGLREVAAQSRSTADALQVLAAQQGDQVAQRDAEIATLKDYVAFLKRQVGAA